MPGALAVTLPYRVLIPFLPGAGVHRWLRQCDGWRCGSGGGGLAAAGLGDVPRLFIMRMLGSEGFFQASNFLSTTIRFAYSAALP
jgi:hypothetical protein